ncbi:MAG: DUF4199 domain-containing protein [Alistipes sp.]|nr:DUF4199 domain-containing protein [Alistipes sp.]
MNFSIFRNDVLTKGAILGCVMVALNIAKSSLFYYGGMSWALVLLLVILCALALYIYLAYRFTRNYAGLVVSERQQAPYFTYGEGLLYWVNVSMLAGVVVGCGEYVFMHYVIGYENFVANYIKLFQDALSQVKLTSQDINMLNELFTELQKAEEPSILSNIFGTVWTYLMSGTLVGLVIAAFTKREPMIGGADNSNDKKEPSDEQ